MNEPSKATHIYLVCATRPGAHVEFISSDSIAYASTADLPSEEAARVMFASAVAAVEASRPFGHVETGTTLRLVKFARAETVVEHIFHDPNTQTRTA